MHEGAGAKRRFTHRPAIKEQRSTGRDIDIHPCRQFHEQIVRMLAVDQRLAVRRLSRGEEIGVTLRLHRRLQAQHRAQLQPRAAEVLLRGQHPHRRDIGLVVTARAFVIGILGRYKAMRHQHPVVTRHDVKAVHPSFAPGKARGAGAAGGRKFERRGHLSLWLFYAPYIHALMMLVIHLLRSGGDGKQHCGHRRERNRNSLHLLKSCSETEMQKVSDKIFRRRRLRRLGSCRQFRSRPHRSKICFIKVRLGNRAEHGNRQRRYATDAVPMTRRVGRLTIRRW